MEYKYIVFENEDKAISASLLINDRMRGLGLINSNESWAKPRRVGFEIEEVNYTSYYIITPSLQNIYIDIDHSLIVDTYPGDNIFYIVKNPNNQDQNEYIYKNEGVKNGDFYFIYVTHGLKYWDCEYQNILNIDEFLASKCSPIFNDYSLIPLNERYSEMEILLKMDREKCKEILQCMLSYYMDKEYEVINAAQLELSDFENALRSYNFRDVKYESEKLIATESAPEDLIEYFKNEINLYLKKLPR